MMPDLGKYATAVAASYVATIAIIVVMLGWTLWRGALVKRALQEVEARKNHG
mgnify:CR=1 FL=1